MKNENIHKIAGTLRGLSMDMVQKANSGHPGMPMGMADVAAVLFQEFLKFNPGNPAWQDRDRFVLSGGHGSALLYALLHLYGYELSMEDLENFRQWGSKTPGHPEYRDTPGVETTTGPLGQGVANAVGMAIAESHLAARFNKKGHKIVRHRTYVMAGDGDLQEGVSHEALSLAGHLKLNRLVLLYDSNRITIDGKTDISDSTNVAQRFKSYGWKVIRADGHKIDKIRKALKKAKKSSRPVIIIFKTIIGYGSPNKQNTSSVHGSPLGEEELLLTKKNLGLPEESFYVPDEVYDITRQRKAKGEEKEKKWKHKLEHYKNAFPAKYELWENVMNKVTETEKFSHFPAGKAMATRKASGKIIDILIDQIPSLFGGSADLTPSNNTRSDKQEDYSATNRKGNYMHYGIREFAMGAIMNGMALHGGLIPYGGTFFVFSDYMRSAIRMAALMKIQTIYVFTHDSIGLGEDGPTHQPVEHLAALRAIPGLVSFRPMDANETIMGWKVALGRTEGPTALVLSRQSLPVYDRKEEIALCRGAAKGAYVITEDPDYDTILMASGSEVHLIMEAKKILNEKGIKIRVVSVPSLDLFREQDQAYRDSILPPQITRRLAIEAGVKSDWYPYVGQEGIIMGIERFGASAPASVLFKEYGITTENVVKEVLENLK